MKIVYVDNSTSGHHMSYLKELIKNSSNEYCVILPEVVEDLDVVQKYFCTREDKRRNLKTFYKWCKEIKKLVDEENPDIVHFLYGDIFYRFFGFGLGMFKKYRIVLTLHWEKTSFLGRVSTKLIARAAEKVIVHSEYFKKDLNSYSIGNVAHIEYPQFTKQVLEYEDAVSYWGMNNNIPVIACIGNTRYDKGLDLLLEALKSVTVPFQLLIAGKEETFDENFILEKTQEYKEQVFLCLHFLSEDELAMAFSAANFIMLPYRKMFNGASGPLGEGVYRNKCVIGPNHGILGYTIEKYHLGYTFESENISALTEVLNNALKTSFDRDEKYINYQKKLNPEEFAKNYLNVYLGVEG